MAYDGMADGRWQETGSAGEPPASSQISDFADAGSVEWVKYTPNNDKTFLKASNLRLEEYPLMWSSVKSKEIMETVTMKIFS